MIFKGFEINAIPIINDAVCRKCGNKMEVVPNGWFSKACYCPVCEEIYELKLVKMPAKQVNMEALAELKTKYPNPTK